MSTLSQIKPRWREISKFSRKPRPIHLRRITERKTQTSKTWWSPDFTSHLTAIVRRPNHVRRDDHVNAADTCSIFCVDDSELSCST
jgi:hypothetical protein